MKLTSQNYSMVSLKLQCWYKNYALKHGCYAAIILLCAVSVFLAYDSESNPIWELLKAVLETILTF